MADKKILQAGLVHSEEIAGHLPHRGPVIGVYQFQVGNDLLEPMLVLFDGSCRLIRVPVSLICKLGGVPAPSFENRMLVSDPRYTEASDAVLNNYCRMHIDEITGSVDDRLDDLNVLVAHGFDVGIELSES